MVWYHNFALSSVLSLLCFIWEEISLRLPWKANLHKQSGLKQRNQFQGQINSTAVIRELSTVFFVLTHTRRSDLIRSRLDLYMDLETPKVWQFTSGVLTIGLKAGKSGEKGLFRYQGTTRSRKIQLTRGTRGRNIYTFIAQCGFSCTYILYTTLPVLPGGSCLVFGRWRSTSTWVPMATTLSPWLLTLCLNRSLFGAQQVVHVATYTITQCGRAHT